LIGVHAIIVDRADVGQLAVLVEHKGMWRASSAIVLAHLLGRVVNVREVEAGAKGALLHGLQIVGGAFAHADGNNLHALVLIILLQGDKALLIRLGHGAMIAGEDHDNRLGILVIGKAVRFLVGADDALPWRGRIANF